MSLALQIRHQAQIDLQRQSDYFKESSLDLALRYLDSARTTIERLAATPEMGGRCTMLPRRLHEVRVLPIAEFPQQLVFYRYDTSTLYVLRVLHGARNWTSLLRHLG